jgi:phospholipase C
MSPSLRRVLTLATGLATALAAGPGLTSASAAPTGLGAVNHIVVIYEENHSFDNLYGGW